MIATRAEADASCMKRRQTLVWAVIVAGLLLSTAGVATAGRTSGSARLSTLDSTLLVQINDLRTAHRLRPLKLSPQLTVAADQHTTEMGRAGYFAHDSLDHTPFWKRIERSYPSAGSTSWSVGENLLFVGRGVSAAEAITVWMNSPEHRANLLDPSWREIGISSRYSDAAPGIYGNEAVTIITTDFGLRR